MDICLWVLKGSKKSRFDRYVVRNSVLIISHITYRDCCMHTFSNNLSQTNLAITERILARWLVESYGLWEYSPWKCRNMSRSAGCFWFFVKKNKCYCKKQIDHTDFPSSTSLIDHRNDTIKCSKLCSETTRLRLVVPLEFWTFYDVISMIYKNLKYMAVNNFLFLFWEIWLTPTKRDSSTRRAAIRVLQFYHPFSSQIRRTSSSSKEKVVRKNRHMLWRKMCATCVK